MFHILFVIYHINKIKNCPKTGVIYFKINNSIPRTLWSNQLKKVVFSLEQRSMASHQDMRRTLPRLTIKSPSIEPLTTSTTSECWPHSKMFYHLCHLRMLNIIPKAAKNYRFRPRGQATDSWQFQGLLLKLQAKMYSKLLMTLSLAITFFRRHQLQKIGYPNKKNCAKAGEKEKNSTGNNKQSKKKQNSTASSATVSWSLRLLPWCLHIVASPHRCWPSLGA